MENVVDVGDDERKENAERDGATRGRCCVRLPKTCAFTLTNWLTGSTPSNTDWLDLFGFHAHSYPNLAFLLRPIWTAFERLRGHSCPVNCDSSACVLIWLQSVVL